MLHNLIYFDKDEGPMKTTIDSSSFFSAIKRLFMRPSCKYIILSDKATISKKSKN